jgi:RNA-binding protein
MTLTPRQRSELKSRAHNLDPVSQIGKNGLTEATIAHVDRALKDHGLIKVRFQAHKEEKEALAAELAEKTCADLVEVIGNVAIIYRPSEEPA